MKKTKFIIIGIVVAVIAAVALLVMLLSPKTIVLDDYIDVEISGYNGYGQAILTTDEEALFFKLAEKSGKSAEELLIYGMFNDVLDIELDNEDNLSNGDTVKVTFDADEEFFKSLGYKIKLKKDTYSVADLPEAKKIDPFDYLNITYEGYDPYVRPVLSNSSTDSFVSSGISFYTNGYNLHEGDTFTVTAQYDNHWFLKHGFIVERSEKTFTASDIPQPKEIDPFDMLTVVYSGVEGKGTLSYEINREKDDPFLTSIDFRFDKTYSLKTGDTITCEASYYYVPEEYGYKVISTEKTFTVPQLGKYVTELSMIDEDVRQQLADVALAKAKDRFGAEKIDGYLYTSTSILGKSYKLDSYTSYENIKITHAYSLTSKYENTYGFIVTVDLGGNSSAAANGTAYFYVYFENLIMNGDGTLAEGWEDLATCLRSTYNSYDLLINMRFKNKNVTFESI